jgi:hypothetical protein
MLCCFINICPNPIHLFCYHHLTQELDHNNKKPFADPTKFLKRKKIREKTIKRRKAKTVLSRQKNYLQKITAVLAWNEQAILRCSLISNFSKGKIMSKVILWIGFIASLLFLPLAILNFLNGKIFPVILWSIIFLGSGYKLFFSSSKK